jgi:diguanylate cyclase (GGDEF)-like protein
LAPVEKELVFAGSDEATRLAADPELMGATLDIYRKLELDRQLRAMLDHAIAWSGAWGGLALGPSPESKALSVLASVSADMTKQLPGLRSVKRSAVDEWIGNRTGVFEGLGPFASIAALEPDPAPQVSVAIPVAGTDHKWSALLLLLADADPGAERVQRIVGLGESTHAAVEHALQVRAIRDLVIRDDTAQCFNRRYFESNLPEELSRATRFHAALSLIFLDMDNLKQVNNRFGHAMGSRTLLEVSRRIRVKIRRFDKLFRFGGDEFCIVLPETEWRGAVEVAERVRDAIASRPFLVKELGDPAGSPMTASLGVSSYPLHARTQKDLIELADRAMQRVKMGTKNSIGVAEHDGDEHEG